VADDTTEDTTADEADEAEGDDGALHHFWRFIELRQARGRPAFDLDDVREMILAMDEFDAEAATHASAP